ncbi:MAG: carbohydrate-binding domain-containing protein [Ruminococcus sp.]|nr:carbohydrate-binding domain-containing protein [Ruminococcus sp.]
MIDTTDLFSSRDLEQTADLTDAQYLTVSDNDTINITEAGVYVISGTAQECNICIEANEDAKIQLVLDGVNITNTDFPAVYVISADKVFITTTGTENNLTVSGTFRADGDTNTDAVIYSKEDLVLNGTGTLNITSAVGNGITSKDDMKFTGGTYTINAGKDAIEANDSISICGGTFTLNANKDAMHCENDEAEGTVYIADGTFTINSASDGIQATSILQIDGGTFNIKSAEGLEATCIQINGGTLYIDASDDGINATSKNSAYSVAVEFNGGDTTIIMGQGDTDAVDSNGSIYVNGGTIDITAPTSSFDYDMSAEYNGGTIIINGEQVSEIPQSMMGGGGFGGGGNFGGGGFSGNPGGRGGFGNRTT